MLGYIFIVVLWAGCGWIPATAASDGPSADLITPAEAKNFILVIGDGMGFEQVRAASYYHAGTEEALAFHELPHRGEVTTDSASIFVTDSAAAGTAMATGVKVYNGVISVRRPGDGAALETILEYHRAQGRGAGLVTTTYATHATPAAFAAHEEDRGNTAEIAVDCFTETQPDVILGGGGNGVSRELAESSGYTVVTTRAELEALATGQVARISGQFGTTHLPYEVDGLGDLPHLSEMTRVAVEILANDSDGFFLMVEAGRIDHAGHANDLAANIGETLELSRTVAWLHDWAEADGETLLVVTSDHETGGMEVLANRGEGVLPDVGWSSTGHTRANVPIYAVGPGADGVTGSIDNTDIYWLMR